MATCFPPHAVAETWHICWQAAQGRNLITDASLIERIRRRLIQAHLASGRALFDYLLTPSEIHVISGVAVGESPGDVAREVANVIARWVRQTAALRGPVFAGPYRAHRLESADSLRQEFRMLAWRPVSLGLCKTPLHHPHSALRTTLGVRPAVGFDARPMLALFGESVPAARAAMRALLSKPPVASDVRRWELARGMVLATGTVGPQSTMAREVRGAAASLVALAGPQGIDGALRLLEAWVLTKLGAVGQVDLQTAGDATAVRARALVACLAVDHSLCSAASVARHFHRAKATLSEQMAACRARPVDQQILRTPANRIIEEAAALPRRSP
jgi:hypothetical protein